MVWETGIGPIPLGTLLLIQIVPLLGGIRLAAEIWSKQHTAEVERVWDLALNKTGLGSWFCHLLAIGQVAGPLWTSVFLSENKMRVWYLACCCVQRGHVRNMHRGCPAHRDCHGCGGGEGVAWKGQWASNPPGPPPNGDTLHPKGKGTMKRQTFHTVISQINLCPESPLFSF